MVSNVVKQEGSPLNPNSIIHHTKAYCGGTLIQVGTHSHSSLDSLGPSRPPSDMPPHTHSDIRTETEYSKTKQLNNKSDVEG